VLPIRRKSYLRASIERFLSALGLALLLGVVSPAAMAALTITVTTSGDAGNAGTCTLRQAIGAMNTQSTVGTACVAAFSQSDTIDFSLVTFPDGGANVIELADVIDGTLVLTHEDALTIDASANGQVTIQRPAAAVNAYALLNAETPGDELRLRNLTFRNGAPGGCSHGGGVCAFERNLSISNCRFEDNSATRWGGGVYIGYANLSVSDSTFTDNSATWGGGGIHAFQSATTVTRSTFSDNSAPGEMFQGVGSGGGLHSLYGTLVVSDSTFIGNDAVYGGGLAGLVSNLVTNSTFYDNYARNFGGAISLEGGTLVNNTIVGNTTSYGIAPGGGIYSNEASITLINTIVAGNSVDDLAPPGLFDGTGNFIGGDPMLGTPADNGGPTLTMLPEQESPVVDVVGCTAAPATDQRGIARPQGLACDIGAVDVRGPTLFVDGFEGTSP
jgi:hypothetical protein